MATRKNRLGQGRGLKSPRRLENEAARGSDIGAEILRICKVFDQTVVTMHS